MQNRVIRGAVSILAIVAFQGKWTPARAEQPTTRVNRLTRVQVAKDIKAHAEPFHGLAVPPALMKAIEGKRVIGLGEGTHGTSEIHTIEGNIILAMAKRGRVLVFLEDQFGSVAQLNQFIQGVGADADLPSKMKELFGVHNTQELGGFFRRAREFNSTAPAGARIEIYGVDTQLWPGPNDVTPALQKFNSANKLDLDAQIAICASYIRDPKTSSPAVRAAVTAAAAKIKVAIVGVNASVPDQVEAAVLANILVHFVALDVANENEFASVVLDKSLGYTPGAVYTLAIRDSAMAENIKILMDGKAPTIGTGVFWGHNAHVGRLSYLDGFLPGRFNGWGNVGNILHWWLGDAYFPIAAMSGKGSFRARPIGPKGEVGEFETLPAPKPIHPDCLNAIATSVFSTPVFFLTEDVANLNSTRPEFAVGAVFDSAHPDFFLIKTIPGIAYGGVISFPSSEAAHLMQ